MLLAGLPGTGKSTLAAALQQHLDAVVLDKDIVRTALFPGAATDYSDAQNDLCMEAMLAAAKYLTRKQPRAGYILFDGRTFSRAAHIDQVACAAEHAGARLAILLLVVPDELALQRMQAGASSHPAKDRTDERYFYLKDSSEPISRPHLAIDTSQPLEHCTASALRYLTSR